MICGNDEICHGVCSVEQPCGYCSTNTECFGTLICGSDNLCIPSPTPCQDEPCGYCLNNNECLNDLICDNDGLCSLPCSDKTCSINEGICTTNDECTDNLTCGVNGICIGKHQFYIMSTDQDTVCILRMYWRIPL